MINFEQAKSLANYKLQKIQKETAIKIAFFENETIEFKYGWIFFYQSEEFLKTQNPLSMVGGNAPILVDKDFEIAILMGTGKDTKHYIDVYSRFRGEWY